MPLTIQHINFKLCNTRRVSSPKQKKRNSSIMFIKGLYRVFRKRVNKFTKYCPFKGESESQKKTQSVFSILCSGNMLYAGQNLLIALGES